MPKKDKKQVSSSSDSSSDSSEENQKPVEKIETNNKDDSDSSSDSSSEEEKQTPAQENNKRKNEQSNVDSNKKPKAGGVGSLVKVYNLSFDETDESINQAFAECGTILRANVGKDQSGRSRGFAFIEFQEEEAGENALQFVRFFFSKIISLP